MRTEMSIENFFACPRRRFSLIFIINDVNGKHFVMFSFVYKLLEMFLFMEFNWLNLLTFLFRCSLCCCFVHNMDSIQCITRWKSFHWNLIICWTIRNTGTELRVACEEWLCVYVCVCLWMCATHSSALKTLSQHQLDVSVRLYTFILYFEFELNRTEPNWTEPRKSQCLQVATNE